MNKAPPQQSAAPVVTAPVLRTEGQRMLLHVTGSLAAIARTVGAKSPQSVLDWRNGVKLPHPQARATMQAMLGIPIDAWQRIPLQTAQSAQESVELAPLEPLPQTSLHECLELLALIRRDRAQPTLLPGERSKLIDAEARILKLRADLEERAELSEDRYVREHPAWIRARNELSRTLMQFPDAARAVAEALERLGL